MEEKLTKIFIAAKDVSKKSEKYYVETNYDGANNKIGVNVRLKVKYNYVEIREIYFDNANISKIDELIEFIKYYEEGD